MKQIHRWHIAVSTNQETYLQSPDMLRREVYGGIGLMCKDSDVKKLEAEIRRMERFLSSTRRLRAFLKNTETKAPTSFHDPC